MARYEWKFAFHFARKYLPSSRPTNLWCSNSDKTEAARHDAVNNISVELDFKSVPLTSLWEARWLRAVCRSAIMIDIDENVEIRDEYVGNEKKKEREGERSERTNGSEDFCRWKSRDHTTTWCSRQWRAPVFDSFYLYFNTIYWLKGHPCVKNVKIYRKIRADTTYRNATERIT